LQLILQGILILLEIQRSLIQLDLQIILLEKQNL
jgi:hypothetical protein